MKKNTHKVNNPLDAVHRLIDRARGRAEKARLDAADPDLSCVDAGTFREIERDLKRAGESLARAELKRGTGTHPGHFYKTARDLQRLIDDSRARGVNESERTRVSLPLFQLAALIVDDTDAGGQLARDIYLAVGRAWDAAREGHGGRVLPADRALAGKHKELLEALEDARESEDQKREELISRAARTRGRAGLKETVSLIRRGLPVSEIAERVSRYARPDETPATAPPHVAPVVDLLCWRQANPRPIKRPIVEVRQ